MCDANKFVGRSELQCPGHANKGFLVYPKLVATLFAFKRCVLSKRALARDAVQCCRAENCLCNKSRAGNAKLNWDKS